MSIAERTSKGGVMPLSSVRGSWGLLLSSNIFTVAPWLKKKKIEEWRGWCVWKCQQTLMSQGNIFSVNNINKFRHWHKLFQLIDFSPLQCGFSHHSSNTMFTKNTAVLSGWSLSCFALTLSSCPRAEQGPPDDADGATLPLVSKAQSQG